MGRKGIGKLSFFGITNWAKLITTKDGVQITFAMDREAMKDKNVYQPDYSLKNTKKENNATIHSATHLPDTPPALAPGISANPYVAIPTALSCIIPSNAHRPAPPHLACIPSTRTVCTPASARTYS